MSTLSAEMLISIAVLILVAVAAGTLTARFFVAASRTHARASEEEI
ncbi:MAG: hypothetical protein M3T56_14715 [Chloroflexota bacterium]|nr:hypothetical protein [Chloroflexota bacterium]